MTKARHLLLATVEDPFDIRSWSGIPFALRAALEKHVEKVTVFKPSRTSRNIKDVTLRLALGGSPLRWPLWATKATLRRNARELSQAIAKDRPDAVLSISSHCIARLDPFPVPTFLFSDSPWLAFKETYARFEKLPLRGRKFAELEAAAARRCSGLFFGSHWALGEADRLFFGGRASPEQRARFHEAPLGANWLPDVSTKELEGAIAARPRDRLDLLFIGRDWERKGGPLAVQVTELLRKSGVQACLHIVGCRPVLASGLEVGNDPVVHTHGPLYRDQPEQKAKLQELFLNSHFMLLPTEAECFGIAFAEAQAFGLPPVSRAVQALPSVVVDGQTGLLLEATDGPEAYVHRIRELMADWLAYQTMARHGVRRARNLLNWDVMAANIARTIFSDY